MNCPNLAGTLENDTTFALKYESKIISLRKCKITRKKCFEIELKRLRDKKNTPVWGSV